MNKSYIFRCSFLVYHSIHYGKGRKKMKGKLYRSDEDKMILGVCGGLGRYLEIDSSIIRILWIIASLVYGSGILLYFIAGIILPDGGKVEGKEFQRNEEDAAVSQSENSKFIGVLLICLGVVFLLQRFIRTIDFRYIFPIILIVVGIFLIIRGREKDHEE